MQIRIANQQVLLSSKVVTLPLQFAQGAPIDVEFCVVPRLTHPIILGMRWLSAHNPAIDWISRTVTLTIGDEECLLTACNHATTREANVTLCSAVEFAHALRSNKRCKPFAIKIGALSDDHAAYATQHGGPDHPDTCATHQCNATSADIDDDNPWQKLCNEYADIFKPPEGMPPDRPIKRKIELLNPS